LYAATFTAQLHTILGLEHIVQEIGRSMFEIPRGSRGGIRGILLYGPPGTGKTSVARFLRSCEPALSFFWLNVTDVIRGIVGEAEQAIRDVFARAKKCARSVIFIDELQALFGRKSAHRSQSALAQLLTDIDNMSSTTVIIGATNRPDLLDPSLLRAGRLEWHVLVGLPSQAVRESILRTQPELASVDDFVVVRAASLTAGFSGADIVNLAKQAAIFSRGLGKPTVDGEDMSSALLGARASVSPWTVDVLQRWGEN
jgi:ATP-dependent 26S proteasome regulatory subunit